jgi:hypothetical protein
MHGMIALGHNGSMKRNQWVLLSLGVMVVVCVSVSQTLLYIQSVRPGSTFFFVHNYPADYYYYLQLIRQGMEGHFGVTTWMTPSIYPDRLVNTTFLFLGYLARLFPIGGGFAPMYWYFISRVVGAIALLSGIVVLLCTLKERDGSRVFVFPSLLLVFICIAMSSSWWTYTNGSIVLPSILSKWTELDPLFRWSYIPSHLWSKVFLVVTYLLLISRLYTNHTDTMNARLFTWGMLALSVIIMGFSSPITLLTVGVSVGCASLVLFARYIRSRNRQDFDALISCGIVLLVSLAVLVYHRMLISDVFPWNTYALWNIKTLPLPMWEYAMSFGPALPLFLVSVPFLLSLGLSGILLVTWAVSGFIGVYGIAPLLHVYPILFLEGYQFIPMALGAGWILIAIGKRAASALHIRGIRYLPIGVFLLYALVSDIGSFQTHLGYINQNQSNTDVVSPIGYAFMLQYLSDHAPREAIVIAPPSLSLMLPAFSGMRSLGGHILMTDENDKKMADISLFYRGALAEKKAILNRYHASYIVMADRQTFSQSELRDLGMTHIITHDGYSLYGRK